MSKNQNSGPAVILLVEDELFIAAELAHFIEGLGLKPLGPVASVEKALKLLEDILPDAALLDESVLNGSILPVAQKLEECGVPFTIISGHVRSISKDNLLRDAPRLAKPATSSSLSSAIEQMLVKCAGLS